MSRGTDRQESVGGDPNIPGQRKPLEPHLKYGGKSDDERFEPQRFERRDKFKDFFKSLRRIGKKPKPQGE